MNIVGLLEWNESGQIAASTFVRFRRTQPDLHFIRFIGLRITVPTLDTEKQLKKTTYEYQMLILWSGNYIQLCILSKLWFQGAGTANA